MKTAKVRMMLMSLFCCFAIMVVGSDNRFQQTARHPATDFNNISLRDSVFIYMSVPGEIFLTGMTLGLNGCTNALTLQLWELLPAVVQTYTTAFRLFTQIKILDRGCYYSRKKKIGFPEVVQQLIFYVPKSWRDRPKYYLGLYSVGPNPVMHHEPPPDNSLSEGCTVFLSMYQFAGMYVK